MGEGSVKAMRKHALIVGPRRVGKSTLIRKVIETLNCSVAGFETKKESKMEDETLVFPKQKDIKKQPMFTCLQTKEYCY